MKKHVVLAYSGGLDTSFCVVHLKEQGYEVTTVTVDTGGFSPAELRRIEELSPKLGAKAHRTLDARSELFQKYLRYLVYGNVLRGNLYPLSVSAERVCQAASVVAVAKELKADAVAHGSTGAGNDQIRFDEAFRALAPELELITPIRSLSLSRAQEMEFLKQHGFEFPAKTVQYSVNEGMWGTSVGGRETLDSWSQLPEAAFPGGELAASDLRPRRMTLRFEQGEPLAVDGKGMDPVTLIAELISVGH
jgi:argininosuccinate synthase